MVKYHYWVLASVAGMGVAGLAVAFFTQNGYAALGRQVQRNVVHFLTDHGAKVYGGVISGGMVKVPMKVNTAVNATVAAMLNKFADKLEEDEVDSDGEEKAVEVAKKTSPRRPARGKRTGPSPLQKTYTAPSSSPANSPATPGPYRTDDVIKRDGQKPPEVSVEEFFSEA